MLVLKCKTHIINCVFLTLYQWGIFFPKINRVHTAMLFSCRCFIHTDRDRVETGSRTSSSVTQFRKNPLNEITTTIMTSIGDCVNY